MIVSIARTHELDVHVEKFSDVVNEYVFNYGLKQILNDAGSAGKDADEKLEMANKKLAALYDGTVRTAGTREGDPVRAEAMRIAADMVKAAIRKAGKKPGDYEASAIREKAKAVLDSEKHNGKIMAKARQAVEARKGLTVDVDDIDI